MPMFSAMTSPEELDRQEGLGYPLVCKTATAGYDGKGQWKITRAEDCFAVQQELARTRRPGSRWILEEWLPFERELSILVVRGRTGRRGPIHWLKMCMKTAFFARPLCLRMCRRRSPGRRRLWRDKRWTRWMGSGSFAWNSFFCPVTGC